jgi:hypothetical protein
MIKIDRNALFLGERQGGTGNVRINLAPGLENLADYQNKHH